ncbi:hypothetical protein [Actinopolymorpha pittospori]
MGVVALVAVVGVGSYLLSLARTDGGVGGSAPHEPLVGPTAAPVPADTLVKALKDERFSCYDTLPGPPRVRSCYRTESDGTQLTVRVAADDQDAAALVELNAEPPAGLRSTALPPGDAMTPMKELIPVIGDALLGSAAGQIPSLDSGPNQSVRLSWGIVSFTVHPEAGNAVFTRSDAPTMPRGSDLPKAPSAVSTGLAGAGYVCDASSCVGKGSTYDVKARLSADEVSVSAVRYDGKPKVTDAELRKHYSALLRSVVDAKNLPAATQWVQAHLAPPSGFDQADVGGLHLAVFRTPAGDGQLVVRPVLAR